jgi:hypothetical protein
MKANIFVEDGFFRAFENIKTQSKLGEIDNITESRNQLLNVFNYADININKDKEYFIELHEKLKQNYRSESINEILYFKALRNNKLIPNEINFNAPNSLYFLDKSTQEIDALNNANNIISIGFEYDFQEKILPETFASASVNKEMKGLGINRIKHKCRNVILIDPYIFDDQNSKKFVPKIPNLCLLLKLLFQSSKLKCFLTIVTKNNEKDNLFFRKIDEIKQMISTDLEVSVLTHKRDEFNNNRHLITDYSLSDLQHIFDRDLAKISCQFLYSDFIENNFEEVNVLLSKICNLNNNTLECIGNTRYKFGSVSSNPLILNL